SRKTRTCCQAHEMSCTNARRSQPRLFFLRTTRSTHRELSAMPDRSREAAIHLGLVEPHAHQLNQQTPITAANSPTASSLDRCTNRPRATPPKTSAPTEPNTSTRPAAIHH